jgi:hypothetical protein
LESVHADQGGETNTTVDQRLITILRARLVDPRSVIDHLAGKKLVRAAIDQVCRVAPQSAVLVLY